MIEILNRFGAEKQRDIRVILRDKRINASNRLSNSVQYKVEKNGFEFTLTITALNYFIKAVQTGTPPGDYPKEKFRLAIQEWIIVKPVKSDNPYYTSFPISAKIRQLGTRTWQAFGKFGKTTGYLEEIFSDEELKKVEEELIQNMKNNIIEGFIKFGNE